MMNKAIFGGICWATATFGTSAVAETTLLEDFSAQPQARWEFLADVVMGGASDGGADFVTEDGTAFVRLTGTVSTANNGGFLQVRRLLPQGLPAGTRGLELVSRGNGEVYYVFLRTREMTRPWQFQKAAFQSSPTWSRARIPLSDFEPSRAFRAQPIDPQSVISIGLVAYGRDHSADLSVASIGLY